MCFSRGCEYIRYDIVYMGCFVCNDNGIKQEVRYEMRNEFCIVVFGMKKISYICRSKNNSKVMKLQILSAKEYNVKLKATIHSTGKLGFTEATAKELKLTTESGVKFAMSEENELYLINCPTRDDDAFKVLKAGDYFSVNTKALFDSLGYDYRKNNIMFDMVKEVVDDMEVYKLIKREVPRKKSEL